MAPLLALDHWVCWRLEKNSSGKWTKVPYQARNPLRKASSNDPSTWADYSTACSAVEAGEGSAGLGFVLHDSEVAAFDLDHCIIDGATAEVSDWARKLIERTGSYAEITPSGNGLRIIGTGVGNPIHRKFPMPGGGSLEIYRKATRYITITGIAFDDRLDKLINIDEAIDETVSLLCGPRENGSPPKPRRGNGAAPDGRLPVDLEELIRDGAPIGERSERFFYVVATLKDRGFSVDEIESLLADNPAGIAEKYRGRLRSEIERCFDKAKPNENTDVARIVEQLASMSPLEYDRVRVGEAEKLNIRVATLDKLVDDFRPSKEGQGHALSLLKLEPWPHRVDGAELVDEIAREIHRFVILSDAEANTIALWCLASHACRAFRIFPRLFFKSPSPECGKTTLMDVVAPFVDKGLQAEHSTTAALFRIIEQEMPTVFLDEADTFVKDNEEMRGIINSGHKRDGKVLRIVGEAMEPRAFNTFCPMVIAAIGRLPATIEGRSIIIGLKRRLPTEHVVRFSDGEGDRIRDSLGCKCARFAADNLSALSSSNPNVPHALSNRRADNWRPLLAVADLAGGGAPDLARKAAAALSRKASDDDGQASPRRCFWPTSGKCSRLWMPTRACSKI